MGSSVLGIGLTGLLTYQRSLTTTGHNISNVDSEGYHRQRTQVAANDPMKEGNGIYGPAGAKALAIERAYDSFLDSEVRVSIAESSRLETYHAMSSEVDAFIADEFAGLTPAVENFFDSVHEVADDPTSLPARQVMLTEAQGLEHRFQKLEEYVSDAREGMNKKMTVAVDELNSLATAIAEINGKIANYSSNSRVNPNDLLDKRSALLEDISQYTKVTTTVQENGLMNVYLGRGTGLVIGNTPMELTTIQDYKDPRQLDIAYKENNAVITKSFNGGKLSGMLEFRDDVLDKTQNTLGQIAIGLASAFNEQHERGMDLDGDVGNSFFSIQDLEAYEYSTNRGSATTTIEITDHSQLTTSNYQLENIGGGEWAFSNIEDGTSTPVSWVDEYGGPPFYEPTGRNTYEKDGVKITITDKDTAKLGDGFQIFPTRKGAGEFKVNIIRPEDIAAASPATITELRDAGGVSTTKGTAKFDIVSTSDDFDVDELDKLIIDDRAYQGDFLNQDITLTYNADDKRFDYKYNTTDGLENASTLFSYDPEVDSGKAINLNLGGSNLTFTISNTPEDGDQFVLSSNKGGVSDNSNMLALADIQNTKVLDGGSATITDSYSEMVAKVGSTTRQMEMRRDAQSRLTADVVDARESVSGVNLDEEAANLMRFQQVYQASAKVVSTADKLFQSVLNAVG